MNLNNVIYTEKEINQIIIKNILKMLSRRNMISDVESIFDIIQDSIVSNKPIDIKMDNNTNSQVYLVNGKVTSITQHSPIDEFLSSNTNLLKLVIVKEPSKKTFKQILENYPNSEGFFQYEFMEDVPAKDIIPIHNLINSEEKDELLQHIQIRNLKKIFSTDRMSRYYNAQVGDIFRIERLNSTSGKGVDYRVVVPGKIDILF
jgi:DNA-directed RNA polymerase subunit H (RpoH/RPB5)